MRDWQRVEEIGSLAAFKAMAFLIRICPHWLIVLIAYPVSFFYWMFGRSARKAILEYGEHLHSYCGRRINTWKQFLSFSITLIEKGESWSGKMKYKYFHFQEDDYPEYEKLLISGKGAIIFVSHLGSSEQMRALSEVMMDKQLGRRIPILSVVDFDGTDRFNSMIESINPDSMMNLMSIRDMDIGSIEKMQDVIDRGGLVIIAGDRSGAQNTRHDFLGEEACFPKGTFLIASLLEVPAYFISCLRTRDFSLRKSYEIYCTKICDGMQIKGRKERQVALDAILNRYVASLEKLTCKYPYQWYNFYDFWSER